MAQFRTTADLVDLVLRRSGELQDGTSRYETQAIDALNSIHHKIIAGGNEFSIDVDEPWAWAKSKNPIILELQPKQNTGTVSLTQGSEAGTFSSAPSISLEGWHFKVVGRPEFFKISKHTAADTAFELDAAYTGETGTTLSFEAFKLEYKLVPDYIIINSTNNKLDFGESGSTEITATITAGTYTPSALATEVQTQLNTTGGAPAYTCSYSATTRKFTVASDRSGGAVFILYASGTNNRNSGWKTLGYDTQTHTNAASHVSTYPLGMISRLIQPMRVYRRDDKFTKIEGLPELAFEEAYPLTLLNQEIPEHFTILSEEEDGLITVRFNSYVDVKTRVEIHHIPIPFDLKDNTASIPLIPRKNIEVLVAGAAFYVLKDKNDDKAQTEFQLAQQILNSMLAQNRKELQRTDRDAGTIHSRRDMMNMNTRRLRYGYTADS